MNEDRKSLCLTCKALQELMTPLLYKDMVKCGDMLFDWPVLTARAASLQTVSIADDYIDNSVTLTHRDMEGFSAVCEAASSLEQLDVTCPCIAKERWDAPRGFVSFLVCAHIAKLPFTLIKLGLPHPSHYPQDPSPPYLPLALTDRKA